MRKIILIILVVIQYLFPQSGWEIKQGNQFDKNFLVFFTDSLHGFILGTDIYRTYDGGKTWNKTYPFNSNFAAVAVLDSITWLRAGSAWTIEKTTNAGGNWFPKSVDWIGRNPITIQSILFDHQNAGWAVGGKYLLKSINGGENWFFKDSSDFTFWNIAFSNKKGIVVGTDASILITYDGGNNWFKKILPVSGLRAAYIRDTLNIVIGGDDAVVIYSTDGGDNWNQVNNSLQYKTIHSFFFTAVNIGWAVGAYGVILKTTDGGKSWNEQNSKTQNTLRSVFFIDSLIGCIVGDSGVVLQTYTGGAVTGILERTQNNRFKAQHTLFQNNPNPFNSQTTIRFILYKSERVTLKIYDILGKEVINVISNEFSSGSHDVKIDLSNLSSGVYFCAFTTTDGIEFKKLSYLK